MTPICYLLWAALLLSAEFLVFRVAVRRDYQRRGRLTLFSALLELLAWAAYMFFPLLYNPIDWLYFWEAEPPVGETLGIVGVSVTIAGMALAFVTMAWFGLRRAFGLQAKKLVQTGPYRYSRNPQLVGGALLVIGSAVLYPSWYALGWTLMYGAVAQMMVLSEEEQLRNVFGEEYVAYCERVPRFVGFRRPPHPKRSTPQNRREEQT